MTKKKPTELDSKKTHTVLVVHLLIMSYHQRTLVLFYAVLVYDNICQVVKDTDYKVYLIDIWGVVQDGSSLFPHAKSSLSFLKQSGCSVVFVSNSSVRSYVVRSRFRRVGLDSSEYGEVVTAGEMVGIFLEDNIRSKDGLGDKFFLLGPADGDYSSFVNMGYIRVDNIEEAGFVLATGVSKDSDLYGSAVESVLRTAVDMGLLLLCTNPDTFVLGNRGVKLFCSGIAANQYQEMGGKVMHFGKPGLEIYKYSLKVAERRCGRVPLSQVVAIGDNMGTDIKGANNFGVDSFLVFSEVGEYEKNAVAQVKRMCEGYGAAPTGIIRRF